MTVTPRRVAVPSSRLLCAPPDPTRLRRRFLLAALACLVPSGARATPPPVGFYPAVAYELAGSDPADKTCGDFNEDGHLDLAVTCAAPAGELAINFGDGTGSLDDGNPIDLTMLPYGIAAGDFNEDGHLDLALTESGHESTRVQIYSGNGEGDFALTFTANAGKFPVGAVARDFNEDGHLDLAVANNVLYGVSILIGAGDGTFAAPQHVPGQAGLLATDIAAGDFNHDGHWDLAVSHYDGVRVLLGNGGGAFAVSANIATYTNESVAIADLNGDGHEDLASVEIYAQRAIVNSGNGNGSFAPAQTFAIGFFARDVEVADFNRDGRPDLCVAEMDVHRVGVLCNTGSAFLPEQVFATGWQPTCVAPADWNEDGWPDLAVPLRNFGDTALAAVLLQVPRQRGDLNCDGLVTTADVAPFVQALVDPAGYAADYPNCDWIEGDLNFDLRCDGDDVGLFVAALPAD